MNFRFVKKATAAMLVGPVFLDHKPHLDIAYVISEPQPTMPFNLVSTATANNLLPSHFMDWHEAK
jgi:hypothetical protein